MPAERSAVTMTAFEPAQMVPGAVWVAKRRGSRSANRIVQGVTTGHPTNPDGIRYLAGRRVLWCSNRAWNIWRQTQGGEFVHVSVDHIVAPD